MAALDNIASELLKSANEADLIYKKTRDQAQRDKAVRLRRIVENLKAISAGGLTPTLDEVLTEGNVSTNTLNVGGITSDYFQLDTAATPTLAPGMFAWNDAYGTADLRLKGNNVTLQLGQETLARVVNKTGSDLLESEYNVVRVRIASEGGAQGQRLAVVLAQGNNDPDSVTTLGIVTETIPNNQEGFITVFGNVNGINTTGSLQGETWVDGDVLYLSPTTPGALTNVKPIAPNHTVTMGYVVYAHNNQGKIFVKVDNGYELDELHNVLITSPANNDLLQYNSAQQVWKNVAPSVAVPTPTLAQVTTAGNTTTNAITVGGLTTSGNIVFSAYNRTIGSASYPASAIYTNDLYSVNNIRSGGGTNGLSFYDNGGTLQMRIWGTGNVSINSATDAGYKLDVNGSIRSIGNSRFVGPLGSTLGTNSDNAGAIFYQNGFSGTLAISGYSNGGAELQTYQNGGTSLGGLLLLQRQSGLVLIGTTAGNAKLTVAGSITASTALAQGVFFNNTLVAAANNDVLVGLDINPTFTNGAFTGVTNLGLRSFSGFNLFSQGNGHYLYAITNNISATDGLLHFRRGGGYNGITRFQLGGSFQLSSDDGSGEVRLNVGGGGYYQTFYSNGSEAMRIPTSRNVLIGTTTDAGYKLDVNGTSRFTQAVVVNAGGVKTESGTITAQTGVNSGRMTMFNLRNTGGGFQSSVGTSLALAFTNREVSGVWTDDIIENIVHSNTAGAVTTGYNFYTHNNQAYNASPVLAMSINGLNVGIGTTTPTDKIHIVDNTNGNKFARISAGGTDASAAWVAQNDQVDNIVYRVFGSAVTGSQMGQALARSASLIANLGGTGKFLIGSFSATDLIFGTSDQARMRLVDSTGNFLIGTMTDTGNKLTVSGNIDAQGYKVNNVLGYTGILNIPTNPPGQQNIDIQGGIVINIF